MNNRLYKLMNWPRIEGIIYSEEDSPHEILGPHAAGKSVLFQTFQPGAESVSVITEDGKKHKMEMLVILHIFLPAKSRIITNTRSHVRMKASA